MTEYTDWQWRATLEDTFQNQEKLRNKLDELECENRPVSDEKERKQLFDLIAHGTLGLGVQRSDPIPFPDGQIRFIKNIEKAIRYVLYIKNTKITKEDMFFIFNDEAHFDIEISFLWNALKFELFAIFPEALNKAASMSKERENKYDVDSKDMGGFGARKKNKPND